MAAFPFDLVSPEKLLFSGEVESVIAAGIEGEFTVLKDHAPFMTVLKPGVVRIRGGGKDEEFYVRGGFADVSPEVFTILADYAIRIGDIDPAAIEGEIQTADKAAQDASGDETRRKALEYRDHLLEFKATLGR